jgi:hypothetical protein
MNLGIFMPLPPPNKKDGFCRLNKIAEGYCLMLALGYVCIPARLIALRPR